MACCVCPLYIRMQVSGVLRLPCARPCETVRWLLDQAAPCGCPGQGMRRRQASPKGATRRGPTAAEPVRATYAASALSPRYICAAAALQPYDTQLACRCVGAVRSWAVEPTSRGRWRPSGGLPGGRHSHRSSPWTIEQADVARRCMPATHRPDAEPAQRVAHIAGGALHAAV